jgi:hypothetical protein
MQSQMGVQTVLSDHASDSKSVRTLGDMAQLVEKIAAAQKSA